MLKRFAPLTGLFAVLCLSAAPLPVSAVTAQQQVRPPGTDSSNHCVQITLANGQPGWGCWSQSGDTITPTVACTYDFKSCYDVTNDQGYCPAAGPAFGC